MIEIIQLQKVYSSKEVLSIEHLTIEKNVCIGLIGNNGAGKTTLMRSILDLIKPTIGFVTSKGIKVSETDAWKKYTGSYLGEDFLIPFLTSIEFLGFIGKLHGMTADKVNYFLQTHESFFDHQTYAKLYIRDLSTGNKNKVGILAACLGNPEILILDEPFASLDPRSQSWLLAKLKELHKAGTTLIISSHDLRHVAEVCDRIILLEEGHIVKDMVNDHQALLELKSYFNLDYHIDR